MDPKNITTRIINNTVSMEISSWRVL